MVAVAMLAGCNVERNGTPIPEISAVFEKTRPIVTQTSAPLPSRTVMPVPTQTPVPAITADLSGFPPRIDKNMKPSLDIGIVSVANERYVYYYEVVDEEIKEGQDTYIYSHDDLYRMDRKTEKSVKIGRTKTEVLIEKIFLDKKGGLYYLAADEDFVMSIYKWEPDEDSIVIQDVLEILRIDEDAIFYISSKGINDPNICCMVMRYELGNGNVSKVTSLMNESSHYSMKNSPYLIYTIPDTADEGSPQQIYSLNLEDGTVSKLAHTKGEITVTDDGCNLIVCELSGDVLSYEIYDFTLMKKHSFALSLDYQKAYPSLVYGGNLYLVDNNEDEVQNISKSNIYVFDINTGAHVNTVPTSYIKKSHLYNENWYLYTYTQKGHPEHNPTLTKQRISVFDLKTNRVSIIPVKLADKAYDDDQDYTFEVAGDFIWMVSFYYTASSNNCWQKIGISSR